MQRAALRSEQGDDVHISAQEKDELVWLEVTDFGPKLLGPMGAPTETVGDASTIEWMERSEIELAVVKTLADQLDAQVWMRDVDDRATGVSICFAME
jgi:hypothetical protein